MVDIHAHILPGLDDGAADWETALSMAAMAAESGVAALAATPHCGLPEQNMTGRADRVRTRLAGLRKRLSQAGSRLIVCSGMEIFGTPDTPWLLEKGLLLTLNDSRYPLIEFPFHDYGHSATRILEEVCDRGFVPVVAHPERYVYVQEDPELLNLWTDMGCLLQANRGSLLGRFGERPEALAWAMLERGFACTVASDAHSADTRTPWMKDVQELLAQELSPEYAALLLNDRPLAILRNKDVFMPEPEWF